MNYLRLFGWIAALASTCGMSAAQELSRLVVADERADWGQPAPYLHAMNGPGYVWMTFLFDALLGQDERGAPVPALATEWTVSEDGLVYDLSLNTQARWHDGEDVTAEDVVFTFNYVQDHPHPFVPLNMVSEVTADGERARVTLSRPDPGFVSTVLMSLPILPEHVYADVADPRDFVGPEALTGTGPFTLANADRAQGRYTLQAFEGYYGNPSAFEELLFVRMAPETALRAMADGEVDLFTYLPWRLVDQARDLDIDLETAPSNHPVRVVFNHEGLFGALPARRALAHSIDRAALARIAYAGGATPARLGYFQDGTVWFSEDAQMAYAVDPARAEALFETAGLSRDASGQWGDANGPVELRLITDGRMQRAAIVVSEALESAGFTVDLRVLERGAMQEAAASRDFDLALMTTSTIGDPGGLIRRVLGGNWRSDGYPADGRLRDLAEAQALELDPQARAAMLAEFQQLYSEELPSLMLVNPIWVTAHSAQVTPEFFSDGVAMGIPVSLHKPALTQ